MEKVPQVGMWRVREHSQAASPVSAAPVFAEHTHVLEKNKGVSAPGPGKEGRKEGGEGEEKVAGALRASIIFTAVWSGNTQER